MARMRYFGNTHDPRDEHANMYVAHSFHETPQQAIERHAVWLSDKLIGRPNATDTFTIEELEEQGMVGVYSHNIDAYAKAHPKLVVDYDGPFYIKSMKTLVSMGRATQLEVKCCPDCKGRGVYQGFNSKPESCARCDGTGQE